MVVTLLLLAGLQTSAGLFATDDIFTQGPLYPLVSNAAAGLLTRIHHLGFHVLQGAVVLHVGAVLFYLIRKRQNLIRPMITGDMPLPQELEPATRPQVPLWRAVVTLGLCAGAVAWLIY